MNQCGLISPHPAIVMLGKTGDIISILPALKALFDATGERPKLVVSEQYAGVLEGVSYVEPVVVRFEWPKGTPQAFAWATREFGKAVLSQFWLDPGNRNGVPTGKLVLNMADSRWAIDDTRWPHYMMAMYDRLGFSFDQMMNLPLVFDRRCAEREKQLADTFIHKTKPTILVNFRGKSSPFGFDAEVLAQIPKDQFHIVDLSNVKASRIYDLIGLYDVAAGVITCDTATLHLAAASRTPYVAFTHDEWRRSVPRGNCQLQMPYSQVPSRANDIGQVVRTWSRSEPKPIVVFDPYEPPSILKQTAWPCEFFNFSKSALPTKEGTDYYNCGLVERPDGDWLVVRRSIWKEQLAYGMNDIVAFKLDGMTPRQAVPINIQRMFAGEHFEDPRVFYYRGLTLVSCVNFLWGTIASVAHQIIVSVGSDWKQVQRYDPIFGRNGPGVMHNVGWEKNWLWFVHNDALHLVYITHPHMVVRFDGKMLPTDIYETKADDLQWPWGDIRGGTPPVRVENEYWSFWHSSVGSGSGHRRYHMGAYCFEAKPPFRMKRYTPKPLLSGSRQDRWAHPKPFVVFPCGAILRGEQWLVSLGVNDLDCAWIKIPHEELVKLTTPVEHSVDLRQTEVLC